MIELLRPWVLLLAPLPLLAWWVLPASALPSVVPVPEGVRELLLQLTPNRQLGRRRWPRGLALRLLGWGALVVGLAGPYTLGDALDRPTGRDLIVAVDLSSSMEENDMTIDGQTVPRFSVVRAQLGRFITGRKGDRVGLIAFGHEAFLVAPLTFDTKAVAAILNELSIGLPGHRTDLGRAVGLAVQTIRREPAATRVLVLLSDGEDNSGALTGIEAARTAAAHDLEIYSIGFTAALDADGAKTLRAMAELSGGAFFAADSPAALAAVAQAIEAVEPSALAADPEHLIDDWSGVAIGLGLLALAGLTMQGTREL